MDTNILSEHQENHPIEIEEEEATQEALPTKCKGEQVANNYSQSVECCKHFTEIKENDKMAG